MRHAKIALLLLVFGCASASRLTAGQVRQDSAIDLAVRIDLAPLYREVEQRVPREVHHVRDWEERDGVEVQYAARRAALQITMRGDTLFARTLVGYWVKAKKKILGAIPLQGSCGVDEPPRAVVLGSASRIAVGTDWRLSTQTFIYPPQFMNPCRMSFANIDVTGLIGRALYRELWHTARAQIDAAVPRLTELREQAQAAWKLLQEPVAVDRELWLILQPSGVWATEPVADGRDIQVSLGLAIKPRLIHGPRPEIDPVALPALEVAAPRRHGVRLPITVALGYEDAERLLRARLQAQELEWAGRKLRVENLSLRHEGDGLGLTADVAGAFDGTVHLHGVPVYDEETGEVRLEGLDYEMQSSDAKANEVERDMHDLFRGVLLNHAHWSVAQPAEKARQALERALTRPLAPHFNLSAHLTAMRPTGVRVTPATILVTGVVEGEVRLSPR